MACREPTVLFHGEEGQNTQEVLQWQEVYSGFSAPLGRPPPAAPTGLHSSVGFWQFSSPTAPVRPWLWDILPHVQVEVSCCADAAR